MSDHRILVTAAVLLILALAACGSPAAAPPPPVTSETVAAAFAAAYAAGDTPLACTYASGDALTDLTVRDLCKHSAGWSSGYWSGEHCTLTTGDFAGANGYSYDTAAPVGPYQRRGFWLIVRGTGTTWTVSHVGNENRHGWCPQ